jgi:hypothetical protein
MLNGKIMILLLLVVAMRAMERNYDWPAGIMLAAAGLLRAFPLLLMVYLALARRWRTLRCAAISLVAGGFITIVMVGVPCVDFLRALGWTSQRKFLELSVNPALGPTVSRFFWFTSGFGLGARRAPKSRDRACRSDHPCNDRQGNRANRAP